MSGDADIAAIASVLADPGRCRVLAALGDGRALPASMLAAEAGVAPSTASEHLSRLVRAGLLTVERHGRHRYFRLSGPHVADLLEALARVAPPSPVRSLREGTRAQALRSARTCYDHLAGRAGVAVMDALLEREFLEPDHFGQGLAAGDRLSSPGRAIRFGVTEKGAVFLEEFGVDLDALPSGTASTGASSARTWPARSAPRSPTACSTSAGSGGPSAAAPSTSPTTAARGSPTSSASRSSESAGGQRQAGGNREAAVGAGAGVQLAAEQVDPLAHADQPVAGAVAGPGAEPVVADLQAQVGVAVADQHAGGAGTGVPDRVGERLLHEPVGRKLHPRRHRAGLALDLEPRLQSGLPGLLDQRRELVQPGLRAQARAGAVVV